MLKRNLILLIIFAACMPAWAQIAPGSGGSVPFIATGGTAARSPANWGADVVNVKDFGATGNGTTDDASAINNAIAYGRTTYTNNGGIAWTLYFPVGNYLVQSSPINLTNFGGRGLNVDGYGATLMGQTSGKAVVDALGTQWMRLRGLQVYGRLHQHAEHRHPDRARRHVCGGSAILVECHGVGEFHLRRRLYVQRRNQ